MYNIEIKNVAVKPYLLMIYNGEGKKRLAVFTTHCDAEEAVRLIRIFRIDSAFEYAKVVQQPTRYGME